MEAGFFSYLAQLDCSELKVFAQLEGSIVFLRVPLLRVEGPLMIVQLVETTLLTLVNYASLVATNAARHRLVAGDGAMLLEFGLRRAQGTDGGRASKETVLRPFYPLSAEWIDLRASGLIAPLSLSGCSNCCFISDRHCSGGLWAEACPPQGTLTWAALTPRPT